uniref:Receptor-type tyrosine-protein phosphatase H n=1 Tax=Schistocephalus solidus TaxID=70667 RepID=A0A0X3NX35_SCHSO
MIQLKLCLIFTIYLVWAEARNDGDKFNPRKLTAEVQSARSIRLRWQAAEKSDQSTQLYNIICPASYPFFFKTNRTSYTVKKASPGTSYWCIIHSVSSSGYWYKPGVSIGATTWNAVARNPRHLNALVQNDTCVRLTWQAVRKSDRKPALYTIVINSDKGNSITTSDTSYAVTNLNSSLTYKFEVFSTNPAGNFYQPGVATDVTPWKIALKTIN